MAGAPDGLIEVDGFQLPIRLKDFCTPDWPRVLQHYRPWADQAVVRSGRRPPVQEYVLLVARALAAGGYREETGGRVYRTDEDITLRALQHFGTYEFLDMMRRARGP